jgi:hypothetical protein
MRWFILVCLMAGVCGCDKTIHEVRQSGDMAVPQTTCAARSTAAASGLM